MSNDPISSSGPSASFGYLGQIIMFGGERAPRNWAFCNGQELPISSIDALYSLLGTRFGGNGRTTFALPDLRGRVPMHMGHGHGLSPRRQGEMLGAESTPELTHENLPAHTHDTQSTITITPMGGAAATTPDPSGAYPASSANFEGTPNLYSDNGGTALKAVEDLSVDLDLAPTGGEGHVLPNVAPFQAVNFIICLNGIYPSRP